MIKLISLIILFGIIYSVARDNDMSEQKRCIIVLSFIAWSLIIGDLIGFTLTTLSLFVLDLVIYFVKKLFLEE